MEQKPAYKTRIEAMAGDDDRLVRIAPRPQSLDDSGLGMNFTCELLAKHLYRAGVLTLSDLTRRMALAPKMLEDLIAFLREEACVEIRGAVDGGSGLRYALTDRGRALALDALGKSGYTGPAPVTLDDYTRVVRSQSVHDRIISRASMQEGFSDVILQEGLLDKLGPALHSGRAIFVYGPPGTGKTYIGQKLIALFDDDILVPHAIAVGDAVIQVFDPVYHNRVDSRDEVRKSLLIDGHDPRYVRCRRPAIMTGGELTLDMLELTYDADTRQYIAPLQAKANNGIFMIDDLGRQRIAPVDLLNRWIVPMENRLDYMYLGSGIHFPVPFELILIFSTNLDPHELADEAFLRRIGHKIHFTTLDREEFTAIWKQVCDENDIEFDSGLLEYLFSELYGKELTPMLPCHPRDLISLAKDMKLYRDETARGLSRELISKAWDSYFVSLR